jgi:hypothetical protein
VLGVDLLCWHCGIEFVLAASAEFSIDLVSSLYAVGPRAPLFLLGCLVHQGDCCVPHGSLAKRRGSLWGNVK